MSQSLYRKYRSRGFDEIVGQSHVTTLLKNSVDKGVFAHAYLFTGPRGTGKTSVARILAHAINKLPYSDDSMHLDIIEIDAASNRRIDDIRDLREKVHIAPSSAQYKVYIIDEVHMLTGESFNALLKTLEEPPQHVVFILATTELHKVPATIVSRTQRFSFRAGTIKDITDHLSRIATQESIDIDTDALSLIALHSDGGFRDSVSLLDQVSSLKDSRINVQDIESLLGLAPTSLLESIQSAVVNHDSLAATAGIRELLDAGIHPVRVSEQLVRNLSLVAPENPKIYELIDSLLEVAHSRAPDLKLLATIAMWDSDKNQSPAPRAPAKTTAAKSPPTKPSISRNHSEGTISEKTESTTKPPSKDVVQNEKKSPPAKAAASASPAIVTSSEALIDWDTIVQDMKQQAPALYSVIKNASAVQVDGSVELEIGFALHRKKLQTDKYMKQLVMCIHERYGVKPEIVVRAPRKKDLDEVGTQVAEIMGGGEAV